MSEMNEIIPIPCVQCHGTGLNAGIECIECHGRGHRVVIGGKMTAPTRTSGPSMRPQRKQWHAKPQGRL